MLLVFACADIDSSKSSLPPIQPNPNGDSELALLMRDMFDDGMRMKGQIENGDKLEVVGKFDKIHTAQATEPEKAASEKYTRYSYVYLDILEQLKVSSEEDTRILFQGLVESCMNCHRAMCPGPMVRIKKLYLKK
tara:strand:+ start:147 stop:551 length:405 start_codon:yes stop_codon:yes gene_type:complete